MILPQVFVNKAQRKYNRAADVWSEKEVILILLVFAKCLNQITIIQHLVEVGYSLLSLIRLFLYFSWLYLLVALRTVEISVLIYCYTAIKHYCFFFHDVWWNRNINGAIKKKKKMEKSLLKIWVLFSEVLNTKSAYILLFLRLLKLLSCLKLPLLLHAQC